jgi:hypothetical protein
MAFVECFEIFVLKGTQNGVQRVQKILCCSQLLSIIGIIKVVYIKMQRRKIGAGFNDEIGIIHHRIEYKFVGFVFAVSAFDGDFDGFVSCNLATENCI